MLSHSFTSGLSAVIWLFILSLTFAFITGFRDFCSTVLGIKKVVVGDFA